MRISTGKSRKDIHWKVTDMTWESLCSKLSVPTRTPETVREYKAMSADDRSARKDVGGFVGGVVDNGRRVKSAVRSRSLITLDADFATPDSWDNACLLFDYAMCCYSTHSHTPKSPRLRYVIPLDREVTPEEYEPIARYAANELGIDQFDITTYETSRLFYWPSAPSDGEFIFEKQRGPVLCADEVLATYTDWRDTTLWPLGSSERTVRVKQAKAQGDPRTKPGLVGQFCRTYSVPEAIDAFLSEEYVPAMAENRYTYTKGSTSAGVVLYQDGLFSYSHHSTDPAGGVLCNAFDLVRLHKFSDLDYEKDKDTPLTKLPSYKAMCSFVREDPEVKVTIAAETIEEAKAAFADPIAEEERTIDLSDLDWAKNLDMNDHGEIKATTNNLVLILENDPIVANKIAINAFKGVPCITADMPWHTCQDRSNGDQWEDKDSSSLSHYIETTYGVYNQGKLSAAFDVVSNRHAFHPVRDYLNSLHWDGIKRAEYLFIHYLGANDDLYTRTVTRKWLTAAVARAMRPGCKFDNLVVLVGAQGIGKSYLGNLLGKGWFSDTFSTVQGKDAYDQLKGCWIIEIAELSAMKKAEVESVKMFISKQEDNYRGAYKEFAGVNKRQCVFYGTTNDDSFLRDRTGNRRFWPIAVNKDAALFSVFDLTPEDIDQIWAEAVHLYKNGESLYLDALVTKLAAQEQQRFMTVDPRQGMVEDYLDKLLPENWEELTKQQRRDFIQGHSFADGVVGTVLRDSVNIVEMAYELFGEEVIQPWQAKEYHSMLTGLPDWKKTGKQKRTVYGRQFVYERMTETGGNNGTENETEDHGDDL